MSDFRIYTRECGWLIQTTEMNEQGERLQIREIGSTNGHEIFELVQTLKAAVPSANSTIPARRPGRKPARSIGTVVSNSVPVGFMEDSVVGHLWLMFASQCHLSTRTTNRLTPVYDFRASVPGDPEMTLEASWDLAGGAGSLPARITYYDGNGSVAATYGVTGMTNVGGRTMPMGFAFQEYATARAGNTNNVRVRKQAHAVVNAVRRDVSRAELLPVVEEGLLVSDLRLRFVPPFSPMIVYRSSQWVSAAEGLELSRRGGSGDSSGSAFGLKPTAIIVVLVLLLPLFMMAKWRLSSGRSARRGPAPK